jgi:DNA-binding transcriptional LysR family regulator
MDVSELSAPRLRAFLAVARAGGFSSGARALGLSQSSLSQAVGALEDDVGQPLFVRAGRAVHLTEAGSILREHAERALEELARASELLSGLRDLARGKLLVGTSDTLATYLLPPVFAAFRKRYPGIELRLFNRPSPAVAESVAQRKVDLGVISLPLPSRHELARSSARSPIRTERLCMQKDVVIAPPLHPFATRRALSFAELVREPLVLLDQSTASRGLFEERFRSFGSRPDVVMEMSSVEVIKRLVELGFGLSIVPAMAAVREVGQDTLRAIPLKAPWPVREVGLVTHARGPLSQAARAFADVLRKELSSSAPAVRPVAPRKS